MSIMLFAKANGVPTYGKEKTNGKRLRYSLDFSFLLPLHKVDRA